MRGCSPPHHPACCCNHCCSRLLQCMAVRSRRAAKEKARRMAPALPLQIKGKGPAALQAAGGAATRSSEAEVPGLDHGQGSHDARGGKEKGPGCAHAAGGRGAAAAKVGACSPCVCELPHVNQRKRMKEVWVRQAEGKGPTCGCRTACRVMLR